MGRSLLASHPSSFWSQGLSSHNVWLDPSGINATYRFDREEFATLEESLPAAPAPHRLDHSDRRDEFHLAIARDARWLLDQRGLGAAPDSLRRRYLNLLYDRGLATSADRVRLRVLRGEFESHYGRDFLQSLGCDLGHEHIFNDLMAAEGRHARHPIDHLLFIHFLGCSAREFFLLPAEKRQPFGAPPWPCLSSASEHYRELRIEKCTIKDVHLKPEDVQRNSPRRPVGEFACDCGFVYRRIGPDTSEEDRYKKNWTAELGAVWESKLQDLRRNGGVYTTEALARRLNVNTHTLRRHEQRLGSCSNQENDGSGTVASPPLHPREQARLKEQDKRRIYREQWLNALEENPQIDLPTLKAKLSTAYNWLRRNDNSWLSARTPRCPRNLNNFKADWEARDIELSAAVRRSAARLMNAPGRPVRVSARAIGIDMGRPCLVLIHDARLPLTNRALKEVAESSEAWAIRRIQWAVDCYRREGVCATRTDVLMRARVSAQFKTVPSILAAAEEGVRSLRAFLRKPD
jgi:Tn7-like transposition protein D